MKSKLLFSALFVAFLGIANISMAQDGNSAKNYPRRAEVNHRLNHHNRHIHHKFRNGDMSRHHAYQSHRRDHRIRHDERRMAYRYHNGHLNKHERNRWHRRENHRIRPV